MASDGIFNFSTISHIFHSLRCDIVVFRPLFPSNQQLVLTKQICVPGIVNLRLCVQLHLISSQFFRLFFVTLLKICIPCNVNLCLSVHVTVCV